MADQPEQASHQLGRVTAKTVSWFNLRDEHSNTACLYCGRTITTPSGLPFNKEHLIARNFVPGTMGEDAFQFLFRACVPCNSRKADIERHVSSVTLLNGPGRLTDPKAARAALNKAVHDFHPTRPGVAMGQAHEAHTIDVPGAGSSMTLGFVAPVNALPDLVSELALRHVQGLFSLLTTKNYLAQVSLLPPSQVWVLRGFTRSDWGHPWLAEVAGRVSDWECRANVVSGSGYFKAMFRRHPTLGWFWALEWNKELRVVGAISHDRPTLFDNLPDEGWFEVAGERLREEVPYDEAQDRLFEGTVVESFI